MSKWFSVKADGAAPLQPVQPVQEVQRPEPPVNPTGVPEQKPMPLQELLKLLEGAGKSILDAGLNLEKSFASLQKITALPSMSDKDREISTKADSIAQRVADVKKSANSVAEEIKNFRRGLSGPEGGSGWVMKPDA